MKNDDCVEFLQWALPQLHMRWPGYRKVRKQVCKRVDRRLAVLGLRDVRQYRAYLESNRGEWEQLDGLCRITISRFYRDKGVFRALTESVLPSLARSARDRGATELRAWCAGCASGEEAYSLAILWALELDRRFPDLALEIVATDADAAMIGRAREACYSAGSLKELPDSWRETAFKRTGDTWCVAPEYKRSITFLAQDIRNEQPEGSFDLVLCRNLVFTYFNEVQQMEVLRRLTEVLRYGASLVIGIHEVLPGELASLSPWFEKERIYRFSP